METRRSAVGSAHSRGGVAPLRAMLGSLWARLPLPRFGAAALVERIPDAVLIHRSGEILYVNGLAAALHGAAHPSDLVGRSTLDLIHPDDHARILARRRQLDKKPFSAPLEIRRLRLDGTEFDARTRSSEIRWRGRSACLVLVRKSTQREDIQQALRDSEKRYRELIERSTFGVQVSRLDGERLFVNRQFVEMFGYDSTEEMLAVTEPGALVAPHDRERIVAHRRARERGELAPDVYEYDALRKDGSVMPVQVFFRPLYWEGEPAIQRTLIDITARREAEKAQRESEERYRQLAELLPDGILVHTDDRIVFANPSLAAILGADSPDDLIGTSAMEIVAPEDRANALARRELAIAGTPVKQIKGKFLRRDGSETLVERAVARIVWQGEPSLLILVRDVNERERTERAMREQGVLLETVMNSMDPTLAAWDKEFRLIAWNKRWEEEHGFAADFLTPGLYYPDVLRRIYEAGPYPAGEIDSMIARRMSSAREGVELEPIFEDPDGRTIMRKRHPLPGGGFVTTRVDITELKEAQDALRASEERYRSLVEFVPEAVFVTERGRVVFCNLAAVELFGAENQDALIGRNHLDLVHPEDRPLVLPRTGEDHVNEPVTSILELRRFRLDGTEFVSESRSAAFQWEGRPVRLVIIRDISERKKIESERERMLENLLQAQQRIEEQTEELKELAENSERARNEAQAANQAKSEFLALMSHELRTPLNAVIGYSEIITSQLLGPVGNEKYAEYAKDIFDSGQHLLDLINDILDLSKVESGKDELHEEAIGVDELLPQLIMLVQGRAQRGRISLSHECPANVPPILADKRKIKQILVNLLSNAIKFTPDGGKVVLSVQCRPGEGHVFQVADTGIGIAPEDISRAFQPFRQVENELNRKVEGTGLGLPLSNALVELHGGSLELRSEVGAGTTVTVRFPPSRVLVAEPADRRRGADRIPA